MSVEEVQEKDSAGAAADGKAGGNGLPRRRFAFNSWLRKPTPDLSRPFGTLHLPLAIPTFVCIIAVVLLFPRLIDLGSIAISWTIRFNVNVLAALVILVAGGVAIVPRALKNPQEWRNRNTIISLVVLLLVALYFLSGSGLLGSFKGLDLGTFNYTLTSLDINLLLILLLAALMLWLAFNGSMLSGIALFGLFLCWGFNIDGLSWNTFVQLFSSETGGSLLRTMIPPDWNYFSHVINPMLLTIQTAVVATVIGIVGALPLSILAARNTTPHPVIYNVVRLFINTIRSIPSLVLALIFITFIGLGAVPGAFGLGLHTISVLTKLYAEAIESVKPEPLEALSAAGANGLKRFRWGVFPQVFPLLASSSIYYWESNTRDSTVVAFVGGGGIGFILNQNLSLLNYADVSVILVTLVLTVALLDRVSDFVRSKIL